MIKNPSNNDIYMTEVKSHNKIKNYINIKNKKKLKQVFSYEIQEKSTKIIPFYTFNFEEETDLFYNVFIENILKDSQNVDDFFERWNKVFDKTDYINGNAIFNVSQSVKKYEDLGIISNDDTKNLFNSILQLY